MGQSAYDTAQTFAPHTVAQQLEVCTGRTRTQFLYDGTGKKDFGVTP